MTARFAAAWRRLRIGHPAVSRIRSAHVVKRRRLPWVLAASSYEVEELVEGVHPEAGFVCLAATRGGGT